MKPEYLMKLIETLESPIWWYKTTVSNFCENLYIYKILYKNSYRFKQIIFSKYATNLKTTISKRSLSNLGLLLFFNFIFNWYNWFGFRFSINTSGRVPHRFYRNQTTELISTLDLRFHYLANFLIFKSININIFKFSSEN